MSLPQLTDPALLEHALTHRSVLNEQSNRDATASNERLEFLGDAVLELSATHFLYTTFSQEPEGVLTAYRSALVKTDTLAQIAKDLGIDQALKLSKGEEATGGRSNDSILADTVEAVIGALYLDQGYDAVDVFLKQHLFIKIEEIIAKKLYKDPKSQLQEVVQALGHETPLYEVVTEVGPDHDKEFTVTVIVDQQVIGRGVGKSKQQAQQAAAQAALRKY